MILMISVNDIKELSILDENLDDKYIIPNIIKGQDFIIKPLLGDSKYSEIESQINDDSLTSDNEYLLDNYIQKILTYFVISEVTFSTAYKFKNSPVQNEDAKFDELIKLASKYKSDYNTYSKLTEDYLYKNKIVQNNETPGNSPIRCSIFLGNSGSNKPNAL